jgi:aspartyl-tRNA(Asn)/glutamyl-tRNA(Gln) amidotransferase subunit C
LAILLPGMTKLKREEVLHVAKLAKIDISESEIDKYITQLSSVIDYFSELNEVDTKDTQPTSQTTGLENVTRSDLINGDNSFGQEQTLSGSDKIYNGYFKVDAVLKERTDK